ncbi:MAG: hypothetical protein KGL74_03965 [Elusimicrobia bacterium]|nr:hypothetical protein [Elusimicrobiota bacterium]
MIALLLVLLAAAPSAALDADAPGLPAQRAREAIDALPVEARVELRRMFFQYRDEVTRRLDQGWEYGLLNDAVIEDVDEPFQPARLLEDALKSRRKELADDEDLLSKTPRDSADYGRAARKVDAKKEDVDRLSRKLRREIGICRDWSDDVWSLLTKMNLDDWAVDDRRRTAPPYHTAAVACAPEDQPTVCLAFDPWATGQPQIYAYSAWDDKSPGGRIPADYFMHGLPEKVP